MATKTGIGSLKNKLSGLRRNSAKVLKKTNTLMSGAISQLTRTEKVKTKPASAPSGARKNAGTAKPVRGTKSAQRPPVKASRSEALATSRKARAATAVPVAAPVTTAPAPEPKPALLPVTKTIRAAAAVATSPVKTVVAPLQQRVGSVLDFQLPSMPVLRRLAPMKPSPDSRASRATSKGKHAALTAAKAAAIQDAGTLSTEGGHDKV